MSSRLNKQHLEILIRNIKRFRNLSNYSQSQLAEKANLSISTIKKIETGAQAPGTLTLKAIAKALDIKLYELLKPVRELKHVRFRSFKKMQNRSNILAEVSQWLYDYNELEKMLGQGREYALDHLAGSISPNMIAGLANESRKFLKLKRDEPIYDICGLLSDAGIKINPIISFSGDFFGLSIGKEDGGPAIIVNINERITVERQIFSAAHELGHLLLHFEDYDVNKTEECDDIEKEADFFASHFLMPDKGFEKEWNDARGLYWFDRILKVKSIFRVSYKSVIMRLQEHGIVDNSIWPKFKRAYENRYGAKLSNKREPAPLKSPSFLEDRFSFLVRSAIEKERISVSKGAEILRISMLDMRNRFIDMAG